MTSTPDLDILPSSFQVSRNAMCDGSGLEHVEHTRVHVGGQCRHPNLGSLQAGNVWSTALSGLRMISRILVK